MKEKLRKLIPKAIEAIKAKEIYNPNKQEVPNEFKGYISSFGASVIQSGLLPTTVFFESADEGTERNKVCKAIRLLMSNDKEQYKFKDSLPPNDSLRDFLIENEKKANENRIRESQLLKDISQYAVALKIALRTFKISNS